jgi:hypothetical protein
MFTMTVNTTRKRREERDITDGGNRQKRITDITNQRRRKTDISQPLDYEVEELVKKYIENQKHTALTEQSLIHRLFR